MINFTKQKYLEFVDEVVQNIEDEEAIPSHMEDVINFFIIEDEVRKS